MRQWLNTILNGLNEVSGPVTIYFRDDDGGWADDRLLPLLDLFDSLCVPIDLAVIPMALTAELASQLRQRIETHRQVLGLHQHGYAHFNHQSSGRRCEFGDQRLFLQQYADIAAGRQLLKDAFGPYSEPIFTPPWNRCTQETVAALNELGFRALSRDISAKPLATGKLSEIPVHVDWSGKFRRAERYPFPLGKHIAEAIQQSAQVGIMLHHQRMDGVERQLLAALLKVLSSHPKVNLALMNEILS